MDIRYIGHASFQIKTKNASLVTDPYDPAMVGLKFPKTEADIVTVSHQHPDHNFLKNVSEQALVLDWPGDYEKNGVRITGYKAFHDKKKGEERGENILYKISSEGMNILHCGDLGHLLDDDFVEEIGEIDILMVPTGGFYTIDHNEAADVVKNIEPSIVIPMHYQTEGLKPDIFSKLSPVSEFLKKMGVDTIEPVQKLSLKSTDLTEETKVIVMQIA